MIPTALAAEDLTTDAALTGSAFSTMMGLGIFSGTYLIFTVGVYIYFAWALMVIAQKTNTPNAWLAWIPIGNLYLMTQIAGVPWWTMLVVLIGFIPVLGYLAILGVTLWWWWKICEKCGREGWWAILLLLPIVNFIVIGMLAWGEKK